MKQIMIFTGIAGDAAKKANDFIGQYLAKAPKWSYKIIVHPYNEPGIYSAQVSVIFESKFLWVKKQ